MSWLWLTAAVVTQWACIVSLRASDGLRRPLWAAGALLSLGVSTGCIAVALTYGLSVAVAYGIWTGLGIVLAALTGALAFKDRMNTRQVCGLVLAVVGVVLLQIGGR